jgi:hypothetical protein
MVDDYVMMNWKVYRGKRVLGKMDWRKQHKP